MVIHDDKMTLHQEMKRRYVRDQLLLKGVTISQDGQNIHDLSYDELKYELVLSAFREIEAEKDENKWF
ncbi:hypothetical protein ACQCT3_00830 [Sutcliffiella horikoshii]|uniref:hypothetical protein n=1 Tax=Sutcliffiella horikoshii TaxID=79883 RepID=UPI003CEACA11